MNEQQILTLLQQVKLGRTAPEEALNALRLLPVEVLDSARLDHHRNLRTGLPEAVFGENKTVAQLVEILQAMLQRQSVVLATRVKPDKAEQVCARVKGLTYHAAVYTYTGSIKLSGEIRNTDDEEIGDINARIISRILIGTTGDQNGLRIPIIGFVMRNKHDQFVSRLIISSFPTSPHIWGYLVPNK